MCSVPAERGPTLPDPYPVEPLGAPPQAVVFVPGSKSLTNRALLIAALAEGRSLLQGALRSDDTERMLESLGRLGVRAVAAGDRIEAVGCGGRFPAGEADLFTGNAGTATRFLTAACALGTGRYRIDGDARMRERPIEPLLQALRSLGCDARSERGNGCPPVLLSATGLEGGEARLPGDSSSQYFSALLMAAPLTRRGVTLHVEGALVSRPYIDLTAAVMARFGAHMERDDDYQVLRCSGGQGYRGGEYAVEPDASTASYFFAAAAVTGGRVTVRGLSRRSAQGDILFLEVLEAMGCRVTESSEGITVEGPERLAGVSVDANAFSDMAQTLYALAPFAAGPVEVRGVAHSRLQECDRISASAAELRRLGQEVEEYPDGLRIVPRAVTPALIRTYRDHRMAMAFALVGLRAPGVLIEDPACTAKTFPGYWDALDLLRTSS